MNQPLPKSIQTQLSMGTVIPAHPLALTQDRQLDERHQRALTRYYLAAGAGGIAVGVHTTQFQIRDPQIGLLQPVLELASTTVNEFQSTFPDRPVIRIAGICGDTVQAVQEATLARDLGYHIGLLSLSAFRDGTEDDMLSHARTIAEIIPIMGFYLQPSVGGRLLPHSFWVRLCEVENLVAIKIAPFNRYHTLEVVRAVAESGRHDEIALYTGNDDNIVNDLLTVFEFPIRNRIVRIRMVGGLLGHWAVWTKQVTNDFERISHAARSGRPIPRDLLTLNAQVTDCNAAFFDPQNAFAGCIAGIHEVLRRQGLMQGTWCLDENETLSPGQREEIDRVYNVYPHLHDDGFVKEHLHTWLRD